MRACLCVCVSVRAPRFPTYSPSDWMLKRRTVFEVRIEDAFQKERIAVRVEVAVEDGWITEAGAARALQEVVVHHVADLIGD